MHDLAHYVAHEPRLGDVTKDSRRQTDDDDQEIGQRQVNDEQVGDRSHATVEPHDIDDEPVADDTSDENDDVQSDNAPFERVWTDESPYHVNVFIVADAIIVRAVGGRCPAIVSRGKDATIGDLS